MFILTERTQPILFTEGGDGTNTSLMIQILNSLFASFIEGWQAVFEIHVRKLLDIKCISKE